MDVESGEEFFSFCGIACLIFIEYPELRRCPLAIIKEVRLQRMEQEAGSLPEVYLWCLDG